MRTKTSDHEAQDHSTSVRKKGGWITLPFLAGSVIALGVAMSATSSNFIVYLIKKYNVKSIDAAQISNIVRGCMQMSPVVGAVVSDAYFGCYPVVVFAMAMSLLSFALFTLTATFPSLLPLPCPPGAAPCKPPNAIQAAVLYTTVGLLAVGNGGTRYNAATMGADQFVERRNQDVFFSWYFVLLYASYMVGDTVVVYVQDGVSWALGFGVCVATTGLGLAVMVAGSRCYRRPCPKGSPFKALARVVVSAVRKGTADLGTLGRVQYYHGITSLALTPNQHPAPTENFRFLNRAAMVAPGETNQDGSIAKPWRLCTVQQVEDLKSLIRVLPLWSSGILVSMTVNAQISLTVLQALTMDLTLGPHFAVPAASMTVTMLASFVLFAAFFDRFVLQFWENFSGGKLTALQRVGLGHAVNIASMAVAALVERRRIRVAHGQAGLVVPMSALWLVLQLGLTGVEEALHLPGNTVLFYQEFPETLRSTATAMAPLFIAIGSYLSTAFVDVLRAATRWLPNDLNHSRLDSVYWTLTVVAAVNFGYFLMCASLYTYKNVDGSGKPQRNDQ